MAVTNDRECDSMVIEDVWDSSEPIVLCAWFEAPVDPGQERTVTLDWLRQHEPALLEHIEWMLACIDHIDVDQYYRLANGCDNDDRGYYPRSLWDHAQGYTVTDIGCYALADWAAGLCMWEYRRRIKAAASPESRDASQAALKEQYAREWQRLTADEPRLRDIEARARRYEMPPHLRGTFAGVHAGLPTYYGLYRETMPLLNHMFDYIGGLEGLVRAQMVVGAVLEEAMYGEL